MKLGPEGPTPEVERPLNVESSIKITLLRKADSDFAVADLGFHSLQQIPDVLTLKQIPFASGHQSAARVGAHVFGNPVTETCSIITLPKPQARERIRPVEANREIENLLNDPSYAPELDRLEGIEGILAGMPHKFRTLAFDKYQDGYSGFGKIPVQIDNRLWRDGAITGLARPMECPEPPPPGSEYILAWLEGELWNWELSSIPGEESDRSPSVRTAKYFKSLNALAASADSYQSNLGQRILAALPTDPTTIAAPEDHALVAAFEAGIEFSRLVLYRGADRVFEAGRGRGGKSPWVRIIRFALLRHGLNITLADLESRLGFVLEDNPKLTKSERRLICDWPHSPRPPLTRKDFRRKVAEVKADMVNK